MTKKQNTKPNWAKIEQEYVQAKLGQRVTYRALCAEHGISKASITRHAKGGKWQEKKRTFAAQRDTKIAQRHARAREAQRQVEADLEENGEAQAQVEDLFAKNRTLAERCYDLAIRSLDQAQKSTQARDTQALARATATYIDKWRLVTNQTTDKTQQDMSLRDGYSNLTDDELAAEAIETAHALIAANGGRGRSTGADGA